ncbi:hypothetical protein HDE_06454 [Halotydeus destructor]|nr:hypothetical protein HDE_06454 [Halotydeus destructor]
MKLVLICCCVLFVHCEASFYEKHTRAFTPDNEFISNMPRCSFEDRYVKYRQLITGGLADIFWTHVAQAELRNGTSIQSEHCVNDLLEIVDELKQGRKEDYHYIDSASSSPSGYLEGTVANFGDFDQCMQLSERSQYCNMHLYVVENESGFEDHDVRLTNLAIAGLGVFQSLCLPQTCSTDEIKLLVTQAIHCLPLHLIPDMRCDKTEDISFTTKFSDITNSQTIAIAILTIILMTSALSTYYKAKSGLYGCFNLRQINEDMVMSKDVTASSTLRLNKLYFVYLGILVHALACPESPRFLTMMTKQRKLLQMLRNPIVQVFSGSECNIAHLGFVRIVPTLAILLCFDLLWVLIGNGPLYSETGLYVRDKVTKWWWTCILCVQNLNHFFVPLMETPVLHTFYSNVDLQLLLVGMLVVPILVRSPRKGVTMVMSIAALSWSSFYFLVKYHAAVPHCIFPRISVENLSKTLRYCHLAIYAFLPNYVIGLLVVYLVKMRKVHIHTLSGLRGCQLHCYAGLALAFTGPLFLNYFNLIPDPWLPLYAVTQRVLYLSCWISGYLQEDFWQRVKDESKSKQEKPFAKERTTKMAAAETQTGSFSIVQAMMRIQYASYLTNYWIIRLDMFTNTAPVSIEFYPMLKQISVIILAVIVMRLTLICCCVFLASCEASFYEEHTRAFSPDNEFIGNMSRCSFDDRHVKYRRLITGGLADIFWQHVADMRIDNGTNIQNEQCLNDLLRIASSVKHGRKEEYHYIDSSSSSPTGYLEGTMANFGDFDQCMQLSEQSQYCNMHLYPIEEESTLEDHNTDLLHVAKTISVYQPIAHTFFSNIDLQLLLVAHCEAIFYEKHTRAFIPDNEFISNMPSCSFEYTYDKYKTIISGGLAEIFWQHVTGTGFGNGTVLQSEQCLNDLLNIASNVKHGRKEAYRYIDSASSSPLGYLEGTTTNFGDFDQCLLLGERSQYCNMHIYPIEKGFAFEDSHVRLNNLTLPDFGIFQSLCLPQTCSNDDIKQLVTQAIHCLPLHLLPDMQCDGTKETSFASKVSNMSNSQKIAIAILTITLMMSAFSTYLGATCGLYGCFNLKKVNEDILIAKVNTDSWKVRLSKLGFIYTGILVHASVCLDSPRFFAMWTKQRHLVSMLRSPVIQAAFGSECTVSQLGFFRIVPTAAILLCFELLWVLIGNGPLYSETGLYVRDYVSKWWWTCILCVQNLTHFFVPLWETVRRPFEALRDQIDKCFIFQPIKHAFYSYIDFQLLLVGVLLVPVLVRSPRKGTAMAVSIAIISYSFFYLVLKHKAVLPHCLTPRMRAENVIKTLEYGHFAVYAFIPNYVVGLLLVYLVKTRKIQIRTSNGLLGLQVLNYVGHIIAFSGPVFFSHLNLIPDSWVPLYTVGQRMVFLSCWVSQYLQDDFRVRVKGESDSNEEKHGALDKERPKMANAEPETGSFSLVHAMMRIQYAAYLTNYWVIRMDLFTNTAPC